MATAFVTGGAEGQGHLLVKKLARQNWRVFAGVLPGAKTAGFADLPNVTVVPQDVSDDASVAASALAVEQALAGAPLDLLMNVAGVADVGSGVLEGVPMDAVRRLFEINTFGQLRVIQAFLPMLRRAKPPARIINFSSGAVLVSPPGAAVYNMSKHAIHGMTLTLRNELWAFGIQVTSIMPGGVKTGMTANPYESTKAMWTRTPAALRPIYEPSLLEATTQRLPRMLEEKGSMPDAVTDEVMALLKLKTWRPFYMVGKDAAMLKPLHKWLPELWFEGMVRSTFGISAAKVR